MATASTGAVPVTGTPSSSGLLAPAFPPDDPALKSGCFDPAEVQPCSAAQHPPLQPVELWTAQQLGAGYEFTHLSEGIALARNGNDWRAVLFGPREELRTIVLTSPQVNAEFEVLAVSRGSERAWVLAEVAGKLALLGFTMADRGPSQPMPAELALPDVDARIQGLAHVQGQLCLYGAGVHCTEEEDSSWTKALGDESVLDIDGSLLLTEIGQVYRHHWSDDGGDWQPEPSPAGADPAIPPIPVRYQRVNGWAAFNTDGYLLYPLGDRWLQCRQLPAGLAGTADGFWIDASGAVYTPTYSATRERCQATLQLPDFIDDEDQSCGLSPNWVVLTKTTLWSITGALRCAIG